MGVTAQYDGEADVLYVSKGMPQPSETVEQADGLLFRYADKDKSPSGVTVLDYAKAWGANKDALTGRVAAFLKVPSEKIATALQRVPSPV